MRKTKKQKQSLTASVEEDLKQDLRSPQDRADFLSLCLRESKATFLSGLKTVAESTTGMSQLARKARLNRENLYDALSVTGNPRFETLSSILRVLGLGIIISPLDASGNTQLPTYAPDVQYATDPGVVIRPMPGNYDLVIGDNPPIYNLMVMPSAPWNDSVFRLHHSAQNATYIN